MPPHSSICLLGSLTLMSGLHGSVCQSHLSALQAALTHPLCVSPFSYFLEAAEFIIPIWSVPTIAFLRHLEFLQSISPVQGLGTENKLISVHEMAIA